MPNTGEYDQMITRALAPTSEQVLAALRKDPIYQRLMGKGLKVCQATPSGGTRFCFRRESTAPCGHPISPRIVVELTKEQTTTLSDKQVADHVEIECDRLFAEQTCPRCSVKR